MTIISIQQLVAHRGLQCEYPENTALSVSKAIAAGALFIEIDIQLSRDKQPMVYHDVTLDRVSGRHGQISELDCNELLAIPAYEPTRLGEEFVDETIAPLARVVETVLQHPQVTLFVELKEESIQQFGATVMLSRVCDVLLPIRDRAVLISFDYPIIAAARASGWPQVGPVLRNWSDLASTAIELINAEYTFVDHKIIPQVADLTKLTTRLVVYEVDNVELASGLINRGVPILETFKIATLLGQAK